MLYVFDMDGVLFRMDDPLPHAAETIHRLRGRGDLTRYLTNNSSKSRSDYVHKLAGFDIHATEDEIMTSAYATGLLLAEQNAIGKRVYVVGEAGLKSELAKAGMVIVDEPAGAEPVDFVVAGWDRGFTYAKMATAYRLITAGAQFIATNRDVTYPDSGGRLLPGGGAIVASIAACTGVQPRTVGKPEPFTLQLLLDETGTDPEDCIVVGDRLDTDIAIGVRVGTRSALVLTGVSSRQEAETASHDMKPDYIWNDLSELP